jgi:hypothetical protein
MTMAVTAARGQAAVKDHLEAEVPVVPALGRARDIAVVSAIAVTQLAWMATLAYVVLWLLL